MEEKCPVCDSKIEENYCKNCAWEVFVFLNRENNREFEKYIKRYETWKRIYNQSIEKEKEKVVYKDKIIYKDKVIYKDKIIYKEKTNKETISSNQNKAIENGEIVIIDGLMYQNESFTRQMSWKEAKEYAKNLRLGGFNNWRLPTLKELRKLITKEENKNSRGYGYFIRKEFIENIPTSWFFVWTSEERNSTGAWIVNFLYGNDHWNGKTNYNYVLCVRE